VGDACLDAKRPRSTVAMSSIGVGICGVHWMQMETYMDGECSRGTERHYESLSGHARLVGTASRVPVIKGLLEAWRLGGGAGHGVVVQEEAGVGKAREARGQVLRGDECGNAIAHKIHSKAAARPAREDDVCRLTHTKVVLQVSHNGTEDSRAANWVRKVRRAVSCEARAGDWDPNLVVAMEQWVDRLIIGHDAVALTIAAVVTARLAVKQRPRAVREKRRGRLATLQRIALKETPAFDWREHIIALQGAVELLCRWHTGGWAAARADERPRAARVAANRV
jgi:hypothetical protein